MKNRIGSVSKKFGIKRFGRFPHQFDVTISGDSGRLSPLENLKTRQFCAKAIIVVPPIFLPPARNPSLPEIVDTRWQSERKLLDLYPLDLP